MSEFALNIRSLPGGDFVRQEDVFAEMADALLYAAENKQSRSEYYEIVEISYDKDGNETGWETIASIW